MKNLFLFCLLLFASNQLLGAFVIPNATNAIDETSGNKVNQSNGLNFLDENFVDSVVESILQPLEDGFSSEILESLKILQGSDEDFPMNLTESLNDPDLTNISQSINEVLLQDATEFLSAPEVSKPSNDSTLDDIPSTDAPSTDAPSTDAPSTDAPSTSAPSDDSLSTNASSDDTSANVSESPDGRIPVNSSESNLNKIDYRDRDDERSRSNYGSEDLSPLVVVLFVIILIAWCACGCPQGSGSYSSRRSSYATTTYRSSGYNNSSSSSYVASGYANTSYRNDENTSSGYATTSFR